MDMYDEENAAERSGQYGRSAPSRASSGSEATRDNYLDDYSTVSSGELVGKDGRLFGMKVSRELAERVNALYPAFLDFLRRRGEEVIGPMAEKVAKTLGHTSTEATRIGGHAANAAGYGIIFLKPAIEAARHTWDMTKSYAAISRAVKPLGSEAWQCETVQEMSKRARGAFGQNLVRTTTSLVGSLPALVGKMSEQKATVAERARDAEFKAATEAAAKGDNSKLSEYYKKHFVEGHGTGVTPGTNRRVLEELLEEEFKVYKGKYETFGKSAKADEVRKEIKNVFRETLAGEFDSYSLEKLKRYGVDTRNVERELSYHWGDDAEGERRTTLSNFKKRFDDNSKELKRIQEEAVKAAFVRQEGAFDNEWAQYAHFGADRDGRREAVSTIKDTYTKDFKEHMAKAQESAEAKKKPTHGENGATNNGFMGQVGMGFGGLGAGLAGEFLGNLFGAMPEKYNEPTAFDMIEKLRAVQRDALRNGDNLPDTISMDEQMRRFLVDSAQRRGEHAPRGDISYSFLVHSIIQTNEHEQGRPPVHRHDLETLSQIGFDDKRLAETADDRLTAYEVAVKRISKLIQTGQMGAIALNLLVGHKKYKLLPLPRQQSAQANEDMQRKIDAVAQRFRIRDDVDENKAVEARGGIVLTDEEIRQAFGPNGLKGDERAFAFALLESVMQNEQKICEITGMNKTQCQTLSKSYADRFQKMLDAAVLELDEEINKNAKAVEEQLKLTDHDMGVIRKLAERVRAGDEVTEAVDNREELRTAETVVANAVVTDPSRGNGKPGFLNRVLGVLRRPKPEPMEAQEEPALTGEEDAPEAMQGAHAGHENSSRALPEFDLDNATTPSPMVDEAALHAHRGRSHHRKGNSHVDHVVASRSKGDGEASLQMGA